MQRRKQLTKEEQLAAIDGHARAAQIVEQGGLTLRALIYAGMSVWIAKYAFGAVEALAGRSTDANILISILGHLEVTVSIAWAFGVGGVAYGVSQNRLRRRTVQRLHTRVQQLETIIDPNRSSSHLSTSGETHPRDK